MTEKRGELIAKVIARSGYCSRREAVRLIDNGSVKVNGVVINTPLVFITNESIKVNNKLLNPPEKTNLWLFNKPRGYIVSSNDPEKRKTIYDILPPELSKIIPVGRLDVNTEGLMLLTNNGELANFISHPTTAWKRVYMVKVHGMWDKIDFSRYEKFGLRINGVKYAPFKIAIDRENGTTNAWLKITITEGKNKEVRKIMEHFRLIVMKLIRVSFGTFNLGNLPAGAVKPVPDKVLKSAIGNKFKIVK
ncbi:MAG: rRNA pseudouridine synthase [Rickettsiales bacterium]|jgi:23S rRNA pseudouridine2605 synthase|nr:rRNA pseudouridine synthase [Rickettsiales bacterium]